MTHAYVPSPPGQGGETAAGADGRILVAFADPARQNRLTVAVRAALAIPHIVALSAIAVAAAFVLVGAWFAALFTGRLPTGMADFLAGYVRWAIRFYAYLFLLTDEYPPFALGEVGYPARLSIRPGRLSRVTVLFRAILAIPAEVLLGVAFYGAGTIMAFITWLIVLISGRMPEALHQAYAAVLRYMARASGYLYLLTGTYPVGLFGDGTSGDGLGGYGPAGYRPAGYESAGHGPAGYWPGASPPVDTPPSVARADFQPEAWAWPSAAGPSDVSERQRAFSESWDAPVPGPAPAQSWRLVLSGAAKRLVALFLVLGVAVAVGVVVGVAEVAAAISGSGTVQSVDAAAQIDAAHSTLLIATARFDATVQGCKGSLSCVTKADARVATSIGVFGQRLRSVAVPASASRADRQLQSVTSQVQSDFEKLAASRSGAEYRQTVASTNLQATLASFDTDYLRLMRSL